MKPFCCTHLAVKFTWFVMADWRSADSPPDVFSEAESDVEEFVGFDARDIRRYAEIANRAPLFSSTPIPKAKLVRINTLIDSDDSLCSNLDHDQGTTTLPCEWNSSSSLVEGELAPVIFEANSPKYGAANSHASINEVKFKQSWRGDIWRCHGGIQGTTDNCFSR